MIKIVRLIGIAYVSFLCFVFAFIGSHWLDQVTTPLDKSKPKWRTFLEVAFQFALIGALIYMSRSLIKIIPFPLEGVAGYIHSQLSELRSLPLIVFIFMFFQKKTQAKMLYLIDTQSIIPTKLSTSYAF